MSRQTFMSVFLCIFLVLAGLPFEDSKVAYSQEMPEAASKNINVEIVLDSSGSMAAATSTGEMRYISAQSVLHQVVQALPEDAGVNVGLRVFGQGGNNTESGYAESCQSSELLVPISGVNKPALTQAIDNFIPVGWTPMSLALDSTKEDFSTSATGSATNVVVLVTDGLETCGGDPVASATALKSSEHGITTYVVGFGTTAEEQQTLNGVAQAGGGQLFGAGNATELSSAIFEILGELEIVVGAGFVGGNAFGLLGTAPIGTIDVITYSAGQYGALPVVVHNNLGQDVASVQVNMTIRDGHGTLIASGDASQSISPRYLRAGGYGIGTVYLGPDFMFPAGANVEFSVTYGPAVIVSPYEKLDYDIIEAGIYEDRIVGSFENKHEVEGKYGASLIAVCFDSAGNAISAEMGNVDVEPVLPGAQHTFQINRSSYWTGLPCDAFLVAAHSHSPGSIPVQSVPTLQTPEPVESSTNQQQPETIASPISESQPLPSGNAPYPLPKQDPRLGQTYSNIDGIQDAATRNYEATTDPGLWIAVLVAKFDSPDQALNAMPIFQDRLNANMVSGTFPMFGEVVDVATPEGFDGSIATFYTHDGTYPQQYSSMITLVRGDELYNMQVTGYSPAFDSRVIDYLQGVILDPADRGVGSELEPTWGIWGKLPLPSELPAGYYTVLNYVPRSFGPIPPE